jgi:hypothetical protein
LSFGSAAIADSSSDSDRGDSNGVASVSDSDSGKR